MCTDVHIVVISLDLYLKLMCGPKLVGRALFSVAA